MLDKQALVIKYAMTIKSAFLTLNKNGMFEC